MHAAKRSPRGDTEAEMEWWISMPKIELHAHLNGSVRDSTLLELARVLGEKGEIVFSDVEHVIMKNDRSLREVFKLFDLIHILTTDHKTVARITKEFIPVEKFVGFIYVIQKNESKEMSKRSYMEAVMEGLRAVTSVEVDLAPHNLEVRTSINSIPNNDVCSGATRRNIYVRLLLSIDRRETTEAAMETVKLALEMRDLGVTGIDLSGNPVVGEWVTFLPALKFAQEQGLYITLHCGEVPNRHEEIQMMLDFLPQRIGHAIFFGEDDWRKLKSSRIPVEICLTSNIMTESISSIDIHHFVDLYNAKHPIVLCTDDSGVFSTSLSQEYSLASSAFGLKKREMFELARNVIEYIFADAEVKRDLYTIFNSAAKELGL
ncbi:N6-mAMP deaminase [Jatropha curcas]|uniref:N6-mAMP deaminase n=1 Tax=Jatropha curcas TaxID=180498 RepID=UPI001895974A|nr:N6-mAMP deaminase [Jatropha curcas]